MQVCELDAPFGAEVTGLELRSSLSPDCIREVELSLWKYGLLLIRGPVLTKEEQTRFSRLFGELEVFPVDSLVTDKHPAVYPVSNNATRGYTEVGQYWHADGSFRPKPTVLSFFHMVESAAEGGDTAYADMKLAAKHLSKDTSAIAAELKTVHGNGVVHSILRHHPMTDDVALFVNLGMVIGLTRPGKPPVGITPEASRKILSEIEAILDREDVSFRHRWRDGDLVIADNRRVAHKAFPAPAHTTRLLHRTTTKGTDPVR